MMHAHLPDLSTMNQDGVNLSVSSVSFEPLLSPSSSLYPDLILLCLHILTMFTAIIGNGIVCYVCFWQRVTSTTYLLIGNMAASDLLSGLLIPGQLLFCSSALLDADERICGAMRGLQMISLFVSTFSMALIAYDRYRIVSNPLGRRVNPLLCILLIWFASILLNLPTFAAMRVPEYFTADELISCRIILHPKTLSPFIQIFRALLLAITVYLIPTFLTTVFCSVAIWKILFLEKIGELTEKQKERFCRSKIRTIKMLLLSILSFDLTFAPVHVLTLVDIIQFPSEDELCVNSSAINFTCWWALTSISFNPFIYSYFDVKFRNAAKACFCCLGVKRWRLSFSSGSSTQSQDTVYTISGK